ncbi:hypothetical protein F5B22DRAFT_124758 [Xylaria bambusicola]|uniref:uncharacterized protein n=1 Tax=Xylaria bambusicola TaxID=326684 RepID=UPI0020074015|nr:uncharacterized protein F5B22DRAFT_124758 [Xylaria bambusicola]KAI0517422.1 hypothetical protein F5B22DRAFT_124758 [Xylaria bambusicola]
MPPLHRHQLSLEGILDFSSTEGLSTIQRADAKRRFYRIVNHFLPDSEIDSSARSQTYSPPRLISLTYQYALSDEARDNFLRAFFLSVDLPIVRDGTGDDGDPEALRSSVFAFADYLMDQFFLPLKASIKKTPQPSPVFHSAIEKVQGGPRTFAGTPDRLSALRGACLIRDHHRCVISHSFDSSEAQARMDKAGETNALDDDGNLLYQDPNRPGPLEVAHIIPHSLMKVDANHELSPSKKAALAILNMFDTGVVHLIEAGDIDRPRNALTLTRPFHVHFGEFKIFFEPVADSQPHTYRIDSFLSRYILPEFPLTRTLYLSENRTIDPPSARLLALHRAIAHIIHFSAAAEYIDKLLREMEGQGVCAADGSTEIDRLLTLGLRGWSVST